MAVLKKGKHGVKASSPIYKLNPILEDGLLKVDGLLSKLAMPVDLKHPTILPKDSHISNLILRHIHDQIGHSGRNCKLSKLKQRYWLPCTNSLAKKTIKHCLFCRHVQGKTGHQQKMADLPQDRISRDLSPFTHVGIDFFGPIEVKKGRARVKRYGVIFTSLVTRAVHLEVASSLDTPSCTNALQRFICRRGLVTSIRTDQGTIFVGTQRELDEALKWLNHDKTQNAKVKEKVKWTFNPPSGAHHGGVWERLICSVKNILHSVTKEQTLDDEGLLTAICEVEAFMNNRPFTSVSNDPNDLEPLTPNHLLQLKGQPVMSPGRFKTDDVYSRRRWRQVQYIAHLFWRRWISEYLPKMQEKCKWQQTQRNFSLGDLVVIVDDTWLMGRIVSR